MDEWPSREPHEGEHAIPEHGRPVFVEISEKTLEKRAAQLGAAAGEAVALLRDIRRRLQEPGGRENRSEDRLGQLGAKARARLDDLRQQAASQTEYWRRAAQEKVAGFQQQARSGYERARSRAQGIVSDYPLHVVVAAGVAGFLLGVTLRARRVSRAR
jgi:ElaB/YqjD/DUF883 family membrane-anchored ribosome-binding protein